MNTGNMRNTVKIYKRDLTINEVGERTYTTSLYMTIKAEMQFEKVQESGSKFDASWSNRLVVKSRYGNRMMGIINNRGGFEFEFQGNTYKLVNFEQWNQVQKFITFYIQKDS